MNKTQTKSSELDCLTMGELETIRSRGNNGKYNGKKVCGTAEQWTNAITHFYKSLVEERGNKFVEDEDTKNKIKKVAEWLVDEKSKPSLLLCGNVGSGKTTLMNALFRALKKYAPYINPIPLKAQEAKRIINMSRVIGGEEWYGVNYKVVPFLVIDDLGTDPAYINDYGNKKTPMNDLISDRYDAQLTTIFTTNMDAEDLQAKYGERVFDRLKEMCLRIPCTHSSYRK